MPAPSGCPQRDSNPYLHRTHRHVASQYLQLSRGDIGHVSTTLPAPLDDPAYTPLHPPVGGQVPAVVEKRGMRSQLRWFRRFRRELAPRRGWSPYYVDSEHHRGLCCDRCFEETTAKACSSTAGAAAAVGGSDETPVRPGRPAPRHYRHGAWLTGPIEPQVFLCDATFWEWVACDHDIMSA